MKFVNLSFFMIVSNCPRCQIVLGVKLSSLHGRCQIVLGVKLSHHRVTVEEVVQCSLPCTKKTPLSVEAIPESECHQMPAALPSNSQAHKRGLNSRQMVVDGEHCEPARSSARPSSVVTLRENNRPCRCGHISRKHCVSCCPLPKVIRQAAAGRWHRCRTEIDRESRSRTRKLRKTGGRA